MDEGTTTSIEIGSGIKLDVAAKGRHVVLVIDGEAYAFPETTARQLATALVLAANTVAR